MCMNVCFWHGRGVKCVCMTAYVFTYEVLALTHVYVHGSVTKDKPMSLPACGHTQVSFDRYTHTHSMHDLCRTCSAGGGHESMVFPYVLCLWYGNATIKYVYNHMGMFASAVGLVCLATSCFWVPHDIAYSGWYALSARADCWTYEFSFEATLWNDT